MFSKFLNLEAEKRERIINAAMKEFAQKGFDQASTNEIVKEARISKGLLFHYFKSKKDLFIFLYDYLVDVLGKEFYEKIEFEGKDLFEVVEQTVLLKLELSKRYPYMFNLSKIVYFETPDSLKHELEPKNQTVIAEYFKKLKDSIDAAAFKDGINVEQAMNVVQWTLEGLSVRYREKIKSFDPAQDETRQQIMNELKNYLDFLKTCFYK